MTDTANNSEFTLELKRKDSNGNILETIKIHPGGKEEVIEGDA